MDRGTRIAGGAAALCTAAALGGGAAIGVAAALGDLNDTTTIREFPPQVAAAAATAPARSALSINDIYRRGRPGVVQVTSTSVVTSPADPFFGNPFRPPAAAAAVAGLRLRDRQGRPHRHELPRRPGREAGQRQLLERRDHEGDRRRQRPLERPGRAEGRRELASADAARARRLRLDRGRRSRRRDRQPVRARPHGHRRNRERDPARDHGAERLHDRPRDSDRRRDQPRQLGRAAARRARPGDRCRLPDRDRGSASAGNVGVGFAIPSNTVKTVVAQSSASGRVDRAFIGLSATPITADLARVFRLPVARGLLVQSVEPGSGAAKAGLKAGTTQVVLAGETYELGGDIIVAAGGSPVVEPEPASRHRRDEEARRQPRDRCLPRQQQAQPRSEAWTAAGHEVRRMSRPQRPPHPGGSSRRERAVDGATWRTG